MTGVLHKGLESIGGRVPLRRDAIEVLPRDLESLGIEREYALAPPPRVAHQARSTQGLEVTRDGLTGDAGTLTQPSNRERAVRGQAYCASFFA